MRCLRNGAAYTAVVETLCGFQRGFLTWARDEIVFDLDKSVRDAEKRSTFGAAYMKKGSEVKMQTHTRSLRVDIANLVEGK